ncbi:MAG TPA: hypothetical protein VKR06_15395 [Ktedonosporobacter sp.]|nr:hypothetical protein [Ktedonosporobacter sp.]
METTWQQTSRTRVVQSAYIVLVWFTLALVGSISRSFIPSRLGEAPLLFGIAATGPVILFVAGYLLSRGWRDFVGSLIGDPWGITALQAYRALGVVFLVQFGRGMLPAAFALPAGVGDILIGVTAPLVALAWSSRTRSGNIVFVLWNVLGMLDLIMALSLGVLQPPTSTITSVLVFPLSLIPTFAVPFSLILHVAGLGQFWRSTRKQAG